MKIPLFFDCCDIATFYTKYLLKFELEKLGHECNIYITSSPGEFCFSKDYFSKSDFYYDKVNFGLPNLDNYDCLVIGARHNKSHISVRNSLISQAKSKNKKVISFQDSANLDYASNSNLDAYGFPSLNQVDLLRTTQHLRNESKSKFFEIPLLSNLSWEKPDFCKPLNKENFYDCYGISKDHKIVSFFPDGEHGHESIPASHWIHKNINEISSYLKDKKYSLVAKLHPYEHYGRKKEYYSGNLSSKHFNWEIPVIKEEHAHELVTYSDFALSSVSCVAFEHYLYGLPHVNVGMHKDDINFIEKGKNDGYNLFLNNGYNLDFIKQNEVDITSFIFGHIFSFKQFKESMNLCIDEFLENKKIESIKNFNHYDNHPVLGKSKSSTPLDVAEALVKACQ